MNYKKGIKNISYSVIGQLISLAIGIFIPRLVIMSYGSEVNGLLSSVSQIITYLSLLEAGVGTATCQALYKPFTDNDHKSISSILSAANRYYKKTGVAYLSLILVIAFIYPLVIQSTLNYWFVWVLIVINGVPGVINYFYQCKLRTLMEANGDNYILTNLGTFSTIFTSMLKIILLRMNVSIILVQVVYCFNSLVQMIYVHCYVKRKYGWLDLKEKPDYNALKQKNAAFIHQICGLVTNSTDVVLLSIFCDLNTVSIYSMYNMLYNLVYNAILSVNSSIQFILGQSYYKGKEYFCKVIDAYETYYVAIASSLLLVTYVMTIPFLRLYTAGADINYISYTYPILFLAVKILNALRNAATNTISVSGHFEGTKWHAAIESVINLSISIIAVWKFGITGVLMGTIAAFIFRDWISIYYYNHVILKRSCRHSYLITFINLALLAGLAVLSHLIIWRYDSYVLMVLVAAGLSVLSLALFFGVNSLISRESFVLVKNAIKIKLQSRRKS